MIASISFNGFGAFGALAWVAVLASIVVTILWLIIGWRAMRAHEEISSDLKKLLKNSDGPVDLGRAPQIDRQAPTDPPQMTPKA